MRFYVELKFQTKTNYPRNEKKICQNKHNFEKPNKLLYKILYKCLW
jgi:hypothetical protein